MTYPAHWEADVVLSDGGTVHLRPIGPHDADRLRAMHARLSPDTVYMRFFSRVRTLSARDVERLTDLDHDDRVALVALLRDEVIGVVRYARLAGGTDAEVAVVVEDAHQGRGLGPVMLEHLAAAARERGIERFTASVLPSNRRMLDVFQSAGFAVERHLEEGYVELAYPIAPTEQSVSVARAREHRAEAQSVARLLAPKAVAVLGASREPGSAGHEVFRALLEGSFQGPVYPVNPAASHVAGVRALADVADVPDDLDLAVIALPAEQVRDAVAACADKGVRGVVVVSGGFAEAGEPGQERLAAVVRTARDGGLRLVGPNAMGVVNTDPAVRLHATFAKGRARPGRVGVFSQSGALAGTFLAESARRCLGLSTFVSIGDRADVSGNDLLQYWQGDPRTDVVVLHLQAFGNPRKFARIAREVGRTKPVVALKSGRGAGDVAVDALFRSAGVIRVDTLGQLFETSQLLALQPLPAGRRVAVVGTSSALAALAVDALRSEGLQVTVSVDLGALASADDLARSLREVVEAGDVDAVLGLVTPHADEEGMARALLELAPGVPLLASYLGLDGVPAALAVPDGAEQAGRGSVPSYASPESAAYALARAVRYAEWRARPEGVVPELGIDLDALRTAVEAVPPDGTLHDAGPLLAALLAAPHSAPHSAPHPRLSTQPAAVEAPATAPDGGLRRQAKKGVAEEGAGVAVVVRLVHDPAVGPLVSLRLGGPVADLLADPLTRAAPLTDVDAQAMVSDVRGAPLLDGLDGAALEDLLHRVARLGEELPEVADLVLDPVHLLPSGLRVGGGTVRRLPAEPDPERGARRLGEGAADHLR